MAGWRKKMEDAYFHALDIIPGFSIFGVLDGHNGKEVA
jgi:serine/threonine protein phosphatase PrpC